MSSYIFNTNKKSNESIFISKNGKIKNKIEQAIGRESFLDTSDLENEVEAPDVEPALNTYLTGEIGMGRGENIYNNIPEPNDN